MSRKPQSTLRHQPKRAMYTVWLIDSLLVAWAVGLFLLVAGLAERQHALRDLVLLALIALIPVAVRIHYGRIGTGSS